MRHRTPVAGLTNFHMIHKRVVGNKTVRIALITFQLIGSNSFYVIQNRAVGYNTERITSSLHKNSYFIQSLYCFNAFREK